MTRKYLIAVLCSLITVGSGTAQVLLSLDSCYALANKNYPLIKQYELIAKTKEYSLSNANKAYLPQVSITAIEGYIFGQLPSFGPPGADTGSSDFKFIGLAQLNQTIWDGGATKASKKIITASSEAEKASLDVALYDIRSRVNQLYFGILLTDEQLVQLDAQNIILTNNINRVKQLNDNGLAYKTDLDEIKVEQLKLSQRKTELKYVRQGYVTMLSLLIGAKIDDRITLQKPALHEPSSDLPIIRPELSLYKSQRNLIDAQANMQRVTLMPKVGLLGAGILLSPGISPVDNSTTSLGVAGLSVSWDIKGLYKNRNEKQLSRNSLAKINLQEETFLFNTKLQATQTSASIEKQKAILAEDDEIVTLRRNIRESYQLKYNTGSGSLMDLLNATEKETESRSQKALHEMQLLAAIAEQNTITGN